MIFGGLVLFSADKGQYSKPPGVVAEDQTLFESHGSRSALPDGRDKAKLLRVLATEHRHKTLCCPESIHPEALSFQGKVL